MEVHNEQKGCHWRFGLDYSLCASGFIGTVMRSLHLKDGSIISDVGSVKKQGSYAFTYLVGLLAMLPLWGQESGPVDSPELFADMVCIPYRGYTFGKIKCSLGKTGSNVAEMTPEHHDLVLAVTSHPFYI